MYYEYCHLDERFKKVPFELMKYCNDIIDEIQRKADLFPILRVLADRKPLPCKFLLLGSASGSLMQQSSESLAGRINYIELPGFDINEVEPEKIEKLWIRGGFPRSFLARNETQLQVLGLGFSPLIIFCLYVIIYVSHR